MQRLCTLAVFQRIEFGPPKAEIQVRFLAAGPSFAIFTIAAQAGLMAILSIFALKTSLKSRLKADLCLYP